MAQVTEILQMKRPVCTVDYKLQWIGQNISSPDKKTLTEMTIVHAPLFGLFIVSESVRSCWILRYQ